MNCTLDDCRKLAADLMTIPDDRPDWLRALPSASDEYMGQYARYYRFFHELVKRFSPMNILEIGTYKGTSAAHLAYAAPFSRVITLDIDITSSTSVMAFKLPNLLPITGDSFAAFEHLALLGPFDILFIDAQHDFENCNREYLSYRRIVKNGGIIFFDDIHLTSEMERAWDAVDSPKVELPELHYTGFGACCVENP